MEGHAFSRATKDRKESGLSRWGTVFFESCALIRPNDAGPVIERPRVLKGSRELANCRSLDCAGDDKG